MSNESIREKVREEYAQAARRAANQGGSCSGPAAPAASPVSIRLSSLYGEGEIASIPAEAVAAWMGCGNPTALAELKPGETVLDLGSGGGLDVILSARRVGPTGKAYGLDMTDEMLALARDSQRKAGAQNVEFLKGEIEHIPLPDNSIDVIISNCVINLSADKDRALRETFRVLKPGGRLAISDIVLRGEMPDEIRRRIELWVGCIAGVLEESEYQSKLAAAGFEQIEVEATRIYTAADVQGLLAENPDVAKFANMTNGTFISAFVRARKPARA